MEPIIVTVYDKNIASDQTVLQKAIEDENRNDSLNPALIENASFPTNIKYIFEDSANTTTDTEFEIPQDDYIENVIVVNLDSSYNLEHVELVSDNFELLSFRKDTTEEEQKPNTPIPETSFNQNITVPDQLCVDLEVLSKFKSNEEFENLPLDKLIRLYNIQNEQMRQISNSI